MIGYKRPSHARGQRHSMRPDRTVMTSASPGRRRTDGSCSLFAALLLLLLSTCEARIDRGGGGGGWGEPRCSAGFIWVRKPEGGRCMKDYSQAWQQLARPPAPVASTTLRPESRYGFAPPPPSVAATSTTRNHFGFGAPRPSRKHATGTGRGSRPVFHPPLFDDFHSTPSEMPTTKRTHNSTYHSRRRDSSRVSHVLPDPARRLRAEDVRCLEDEKVRWPEDGRCYRLLHQGPCDDGEWLVLTEGVAREILVTCAPRPCPCTADEPMLCEVLYRGKDEPGCDDRARCRVSLAAEQDGICGHNEQLLISPFGTGVCGCRTTPRPHLRQDGVCVPVHTRGRCPPGYTLQVSSGEPACVAALCREEEMILHTDGRCYEADTRGPCDEGSEFTFHGGAVDPMCKPRRKVKRMFDMAPSTGNTGMNKLTGLGTSGGPATDEVVGGMSVSKEKKATGTGVFGTISNVEEDKRRKSKEDGARDFLYFLSSFLVSSHYPPSTTARHRGY